MSLTDAEFSKLIAHAFGEDSQGVGEILADNPEARAALEEIRALRVSGEQVSGVAVAKVDTATVLRRVSERVMDHSPVATLGRETYSRNPMPRWVGYVAAALVIAVLGIQYIPNIHISSNMVPQSRAYSTVKAQRARITLPDGSVMLLAPDTKVLVSGRNIQLDGEALFTVTPHADSPFIVSVDGVTTRVLGTTFAVRKYPEDKAVRVVVAEGRVAVNDAILSNGDIAIASGNVRVMHDAEGVAAFVSFAQGRLVIDGQSLAEIELQLERWLDVEITIDPTVTHKPFSTTLQHERVSETLLEIAALTNSVFTLNGRSVEFRSNP